MSDMDYNPKDSGVVQALERFYKEVCHVQDSGDVRHYFFHDPHALLRAAKRWGKYPLGSAWGVNGRIVALGWEKNVFVISVKEKETQ